MYRKLEKCSNSSIRQHALPRDDITSMCQGGAGDYSSFSQFGVISLCGSVVAKVVVQAQTEAV